VAYSIYYDRQAIADAVSQGRHRQLVGGLWDEMGALQLAFLQAQGLRPQHRLLDIGCGSLRFGVRAVAYLDANNYWGTDLRAELVEAGYRREIVPLGLSGKLDRSQVVEDADFAFPTLPKAFDFVVATSVFTHLPPAFLTRCLASLAKHLEGPSAFYFTIFEPAGPFTEPSRQTESVTTHHDRDPFHYRIEDVQAAAAGLPWRIERLGDWAHPRNQKMVCARLSRRLAG